MLREDYNDLRKIFEKTMKNSSILFFDALIEYLRTFSF